MSNVEDYLIGNIYHMVHFNNLQSIFSQRMLLSKEQVMQKKLRYESIAYENVQSLRDRVFVWRADQKKYRSLHSYVPFYFATRTPMLYVQYKKGIQNNIVVFEVNRSILRNQGVLFTDGNASNQQLSVTRGERVGITPCTNENKLCQRRYLPGGPYGTNSNRSEFFSDELFLDRLRWEFIEDEWFNSDEKTRIKHAEVLVPDSLPLDLIQAISVNSENMAKAVNQLIAIASKRMNLGVPFSTYKPALFFQ
ncbi:MAG: DUF4433 domain-containing protein [Ktedonobacteraceae bacterium]